MHHGSPPRRFHPDMILGESEIEDENRTDAGNVMVGGKWGNNFNYSSLFLTMCSFFFSAERIFCHLGLTLSPPLPDLALIFLLESTNRRV